MTRKETIEKLDELIAYLNSCRGRDIDRFNLEQKVHSILEGLPISASTRSAIENVRASVKVPNEVLKYSSVDAVGAEHDKIVIVEMINILNQEKGIQVQAMQDEAQQKALKEQKKGNWIQIATLICSIVAALAALYPIIESLIKKMLN